jgi:hypothetical protein
VEAVADHTSAAAVTDRRSVPSGVPPNGGYLLAMPARAAAFSARTTRARVVAVVRERGASAML